MQSNNQIAETPKLRILATVTEKKVIDKEISLPYYFKGKYGSLIKIINSTHSIEVSDKKDWWSASVVSTAYCKDRLAESDVVITADEFDAAYSKAMMYVDLINRNEDPSKEVDENIQIDEMLERRVS